MNAWLIPFLLTLARCSEDMDRELTLYDGYPFDVLIKIPGFNGSAYEKPEIDEKIAFIVDEKLTDGGVSFHGLPLQDLSDSLTLNIESPEGGSNLTITIRFLIEERDEADQEKGWYPAADIDFGRNSLYQNDRKRLFGAIKEISEKIEYPIEFMKVYRPEVSQKDWRLEVMACKNCSKDNFNVNVLETINRIQGEIGDGMHSVDGETLKFRTTKEFAENFKTVSGDGIDRTKFSAAKTTTESLTTVTEAAIVTTSTTTEPTTTSTTTEPTSTSTTTEPTTTSTTTERTTTSTTTEPTTTSTTTEPTSTSTTTEPTTTSTTTEPTTTSTTTEPTTTSTTPEPTTTSTTTEPTTTSTTTEPTTTSTTAIPTTTTAASTTDRAAAIIRTDKEPPFRMATEIPAPTEDDIETAARLDEYYPEASPKDNSGASVAMPLFTVVVLLALASAVAVFTVARARNLHRKTFVIGNASPEEINDIVVLGHDDAFN